LAADEVIRASDIEKAGWIAKRFEKIT